MAVVITVAAQAAEQRKCSVKECTRSEDMLKCSLKECLFVTHLTCAKLTAEDVKKLRSWYCSERCQQNDDPVELRNKCASMKSVLNKTADSLQKYQALYNNVAPKIKLLENENLQLTEQVASLKAELQENANKSFDEASIQHLLGDSSDEELKKNLTSALKDTRGLSGNSSSPIARDRNAATTKKVSEMTETEKLTYYQRLHVQRLEVPKLMHYSGDAAEWLTFKSNYKRLKEKGEYDNDTMIEKLRESLTGEAERYVKQRLNQPFANADNIMDVLKKKFFQPKEAVANALTKLESWTTVPEKCRKALESFLFEVDNYIFLCETLKFQPELAVAINSRITNKLPYDLEMKWQRRVVEKKIKGNIKELSEFLWTIVPNLPLRESVQQRDESRRARASVNFAQSDTQTSSETPNKGARREKPDCWYCGNKKKHYLYRCDSFKALNHDEKLKWLSTNKICSRCLGSNQHAALNCPREGKIPHCRRNNCPNPANHCTIMHPAQGSNAIALHINAIGKTLFKMVPVYVFDGNGNRVTTTLLMDRGAGASLVNRAFFDTLGIEGEEFQLRLNWLQPSTAHPDSNAIRHTLKIAPIHDPTRIITLNDMSALSGVTLPLQEQDPKALMSEYSYLRNAKIPAFSRQRPQILLGLPHSRHMVSLETICDDSQESAPIAERTPLGWTVSGSHWSSKSVFHICEEGQASCSHAELEERDGITLNELHETIKHFNSFDVLGICENRQHLCRDDSTALKIMRHTMRQVGERYEIGLYWKAEECTLPNNHATALKRLRTTETRLKKLDMVDWANQHQKTLQDLGFVRKATENDLNPKTPHKRVNYVIGFVTFNQNKSPPKPRWVVDTASKHDGVSLNSQLLKGPDNLIPLTQALFHFRERAIATVGDVTKMYHQILIKKEDQQVQRFLWRDCDESREPTTFIFQSMLFGPTCSPSQANSVRIDVAKKLKNKFPGGSRVALTSMYMDDEFNSEDSTEEAAAVANETIKMFQTISWDSVGFKSNSGEVLKLLPQNNVDTELVLDLRSEDEVINRKVLGISWNPKSDTFVFKVAKNEELISLTLHDDYHPTKLELLSFIMRIFDCLGIISHFVIRGRMILQTIWRRGIGWNQKIPDDINDALRQWMEKFAEIERLQIPRHYGYDSRISQNVTLHVFVDASLEAYAAVAFIRFENNGHVHVSQVMSKCRVAPVKYTSVPKLELMAGLIGARLANTIKKQHTRMTFDSTTFWSDSITVLRWLYSPSIRLQQFVAPRVSEIQETTSVNEWRYVPTAQNVADDGTKWNDIDFSSPAQRWLKGPGFLWQHEDEWPAKFPANVNLEEHSVMMAALQQPVDASSSYYGGVVEGVSPKIRASWKHYRMVIARVNRFRRNLISKWLEKHPERQVEQGHNGPSNTDETISPEEIRDAEHLIFRLIQQCVFKEERANLSKGRPVKSSSKLYALNAYMHNDGLLRAKTRMCLEEAIPFDMKCPPILPNKHETVHAFVKYLHERSLHVGAEGTAAEARSQVWIIHVRKAVKRVKNQCLYCIDQKARHQIPPTAPLPSFRLTPTTSAFEHCGVDCCGPFTIYTGKSRHKRDVWVVVFTCMITRAVYLRMLDAMSGDEMLLAIQDVWTRRGPIRHMYSDNGTNFVASARIITANHLQHLAEDKRIRWHFIPALTPQWGGAWERLIRDIKRAMKAEMKGKVLREKVFQCMLLQVEDLMNARPLTNLPASPDDLSPLTPNYLVKLHPGYAFVQGDAKVDSDEDKLYAKKARRISENLVSRWTKEYLSGIANPKAKDANGKGLEVGDYVIYTDPQVRPADWRRGVVAEVYRGRDGLARVADVKTKDGILPKRSVVRLAKLKIDEKYFSDATCLLLEITERTLKSRTKLRNAGTEAAPNKQKHARQEVSHTVQKCLKLVETMEKEKELGANAIVRLWNELGEANFHAREQVTAKRIGTAITVSELLNEERWADTENTRTIKLNRIPRDCNLMLILTTLAKRNWPLSRLVVDSVAQLDGCFAYITFERSSTKHAALEAGTVKLASRDCRITEPRGAKDILKTKGLEYSFINWNHERLTDCLIVLARQKDTKTREHAMPRFSGQELSEYAEYSKSLEHARIKVENPRRTPDAIIEGPAPSPRLRSIIVIPNEDQIPRRKVVIVSRKKPITRQRR
jgi:hypothetical protein